MLTALAAEDPDARQEWIERWRSWPGRDVGAHPGYVELFLDPDERAVCLAWESDGASVLFPLVLRDLPRELGRVGQDLASPYGYGGPFLVRGASDGAHGFWADMERWARAQGVVSAFARLSLFESELVPVQVGDVQSHQRNVVVDLGLDSESLWRAYEHKVRKNVNRARREGLEFQVDLTGDTLDEFRAIYQATMDRRDAAESYRFTDAFFNKIRNDLGGSFVLANVRDGGRLVSTELVLLSADKVYSFLGGTLAEAFPKRPNDLLKHELIMWSKSEGKRYFVLGGGYGSDDGIFRYKSSFAPTGHRAFSTWRWVLDDSAYQDLLDRRRMVEPAGWSPSPTFFPAYRG